MPRKSDFQRDVDAIVGAVKGRQKKERAALERKHDERTFVQRAELQALRDSNASDEEIEATRLRHRREHRDIDIDALAKQRKCLEEFRAEQAKLPKPGWTPNWPKGAVAIGDRRSLQYWDTTIQHASREQVVEWLRLSRRPIHERPAPNRQLPVGIPDFEDWRKYPAMEARIEEIRRDGAPRLKRQLRDIEYPLRGRPKTAHNQAALTRAKRDRDRLTRRLQAARRGKDETGWLWEVDSILADVTGWSEEERRRFLQGLATQKKTATASIKAIKPSAIAAHVVHRLRPEVPLSLLRTGRNELAPLPRPKRLRAKSYTATVERQEAEIALRRPRQKP